MPIPALGGPDLFPTNAGKSSGNLWNWGVDNLLPVRLELLARTNAIHRGIIKSKAKYVSGKGFGYDDSDAALMQFVQRANGSESLADVVRKLVYDKTLFGNAFLEVVEYRGRLLLFAQDASRCRLTQSNASDEETVIISKDWTQRIAEYDERLPLYPKFKRLEDGTNRSILHIKDYEPTFMHYGVPDYIGGLTDARIGSKTSRWNERRLDNSFQLSGIMTLIDENADEAQLVALKDKVTREYASNPGRVMFVTTNSGGQSTFQPIQSANDGDWIDLHNVSKNDMVTAHGWFISLAGLDYTTGISSERILSEYSVALSTVIEPEQERMLDVIRMLLANVSNIDASSLQFVNRPPIIEHPAYMRIWEARKADGMEYDETDEMQQLFLAQIKSGN